MTAGCPPPVVDALAIADFLNLILGLDDVRAATAKQR